MAPSPKLGPKKISSTTRRRHSNGPSSSSSQPVLDITERVLIQKLATLMPHTPQDADPTDVVLQAASYIDRLAATIQARVKNGTLPAEALAMLPPAYKKPARRTVTNKKSKMEKKR